ncbi:MAG TPA: transcription-repair coupling factor [Mycobacteriales bacterium]|nr:transcription-repair coupling factor [Mycobacteriales bacterium]
MSVPGLVDVVAGDPALRRAAAAAGAPALSLTAPAAMRPFAIAALARETGRTLLAVTATGRESEDLVAALRCLLDPTSVVEFPAWETLPHERLSPRADTVGRRVAVLRRLAHPDEAGPVSVVVAPVRAVLQPQVADLGELEPIRVRSGDSVELDRLVEQLVDYAYVRVDLVEKRGEFAVRGGIVDVFPPTEEHPVRVELWGDDVEEVRAFAAASQRSLGLLEHGLWAPPCRELLLTPDVRQRAKDLLQRHPELSEILDRIADGTPVEGMEALAPVLVDRLTLLVEELPAGSHVVLCDPERVRTRAHELVRTSAEFLEASWAVAAGGGKAPVDLGAAAYRSVDEVRERAGDVGLPWWTVTPFSADEAAEDESLVIGARPHDAYRGDMDRVVGDVRDWLRAGWRVVFVTEGHGPAERLAEVLGAADVGVRVAFDLEEAPDPGVAYVTTATLDGGFVAAGLKLAVLTEIDLSGQRSATKDMRRMPSRRKNAIDLMTLAPGDYVVHEQHGVGRYVGMERRTIHGGEREFLVLEYARGDQLRVPTDALDLITRYVGGESPSLHRLGGSDWAKAKGRARKAVKEIAAGLIRLYSARMASPGFRFSADTPWQRELEDAFPYVETPDQLAAINEVKADMESGVPMDRVICGDVGYGKTEIAVRAAFKAVQDGKQVAILVPTTLLVQQHYATFSERFAQFPVVVRAVSRFNSAREQQAVLDGLAEGTVDVVIGTHRLLSAATKFKDLGLVVVDEEQRFGVEHKEHLKSLRVAVDVLTMSATPIPRTLEMAITGIRELSTIDTPPEERHPVLTFVGAYDEKQAGAAIRRELLREGQVFYIHNRVESIERAAAKLRQIVPEARIATAHGQMPEDALERVMLDFWEKQYDVLVCTTIVESGLDVSNANTLVVERADVLGLSQLHQLRGRVGRGRERAYAYFLYPPERPLTEVALDRLATIAQHSELGGGMAVAMKDLEIRGAGNLLGGEQSGHIAAVGFDLYVRLVGEAVAEFKGEAVEPEVEVQVDVPVTAHLPHSYIPEERLRIQAYRRLAAATGDDELAAVREELEDRYGPLPDVVANLVAVAQFRERARRHGLREVTVQGKHLRFGPLELPESAQLRLARLYPGSIVKAPVRTVLVPKPDLRDTALLDWCSALLDAVAPQPAAAAAASPEGTRS